MMLVSARSHAPAATFSMADSSTAAPPISVLVIEDVMDTADSLARFLHVGAGFEVRVAYNGESG